MDKENVIIKEVMDNLNNRFILKRNEKQANRWYIIDAGHGVIYTFLEKNYFKTVKTGFVDDAQKNLSYAEKMHLRYEMEFWFLLKHHDLAYPDEEFTFQPLEYKKGYYKITHNQPLLYEVIVREEGSTKELAKSLRKLADICEKQNKIIL